MSPVIVHAGPNLPLSLDVATTVLGVGTLVFAVVAYDLYRRFTAAAGGDAWR